MFHASRITLHVSLITLDKQLEKDQNIPSHEKRRLQVYADDEDVIVKVLGIPEADYECVMVNGSWPDKSLLEGDIVLCAEGREPLAGDIVLIEEDGRVRLGVLAEPGFLETRQGSRPIETSERVVGVGVALARKLSGGLIDFSL
ncbi:MAG TPA: hypothetical protein VFF31_12120 [Blastocatellia bacterium]|nr:hypothetical protein [Blastocatellia bacterium]